MAKPKAIPEGAEVENIFALAQYEAQERAQRQEEERERLRAERKEREERERQEKAAPCLAVLDEVLGVPADISEEKRIEIGAGWSLIDVGTLNRGEGRYAVVVSNSYPDLLLGIRFFEASDGTPSPSQEPTVHVVSEHDSLAGSRWHWGAHLQDRADLGDWIIEDKRRRSEVSVS